MSQRDVPRFLAKTGVLCLPLLLLSLLYAFDDPFKVIRPYSCYYRSGYASNVTLNRDYVSLETFLRHQGEEHWDSFIFGNSRSIFYEVSDWAPCIGSERTYHFDATGESLYGITRKLQFLERNHVAISNALIVLDAETLRAVTNSTDHLFIKHPLLSGQSRIGFQFLYLKTFFSAKFLLGYLDGRLLHSLKNYLAKNHLVENLAFDYDVRHNEIRFGPLERSIADDPDGFYDSRKAAFYARPLRPEASAPVIHEAQKTMLAEVARILNNRRAEYHLVINPLYDQQRLNPADLACLEQLFGATRVHDFSGINAMTSDRRNYYDPSHYRPHVARQIMSEVYKNPPTARASMNRILE